MSVKVVPPDIHYETSPFVLHLLDVTYDFANTIMASPAAQRDKLQFLEMGCGSGYLSVLAAKKGFQVTAADINPHAVTLTTRNAKNNSVSVLAVQSNLFSNIAEDSQFDIIAFAPPTFATANPQLMMLKHFINNLLPDVFTRLAGNRAQALSLQNPDSGRVQLLRSFIEQGIRILRTGGIIYLTVFAEDLKSPLFSFLHSNHTVSMEIIKLLDPVTGLTMVSLCPSGEPT